MQTEKEQSRTAPCFIDAILMANGRAVYQILGSGIYPDSGAVCEVFFFKLIGRKKSADSLSDEHTDDYKDLDKAVAQQSLNGVVGIGVLIIFELLVARVFSN